MSVEPESVEPEEFNEAVKAEVESQREQTLSRWTVGHVHVWRPEYDECMIKGCGRKKNERYE